MLLWAGLSLIILGFACVPFDRRTVHFIYDRVGPKFHRFLQDTTHFAKAAHWLTAAVIVYALTWIYIYAGGTVAAIKLAFQCALAFILSLIAGSAILHGTKLILGRRRPRDELEMGLYGFSFFRFSPDWNSFPSGHALTIACVAVLATALWPMGAPLWFAIALWLGLTRALLTAHFVSDVLVGFGVGLIGAREVMVNLFHHLALPWF